MARALVVSHLTLIFCGETNTTQVAVKSIAWNIDTISIAAHITWSADVLTPQRAVTTFDMPMAL